MNVISEKQDVKRLNLVLPFKLFFQMQQVAKDKGTTITDLLKWFITLGLLAVELEKDPDQGVVIRQKGEEERKVRFFSL